MDGVILMAFMSEVPRSSGVVARGVMHLAAKIGYKR